MTSPRHLVRIKIGWLYLSETEIEQAEKLIASLKEDDAADSLGLRRLNDLIADWLYPGLTTPMTRARYFVFIPTFLRALEERRHRTPALARAASKAAQHELQKAIGRVDGNIGRKSKENLKKWPTTIYWNGLRTLKILTAPISESAYYRAISKIERVDWRSDDGTEHGEVEAFWDRDCPVVRELRRKSREGSVPFPLTKREARYLEGKFLGLESAGTSLLGYRLKRRDGRDAEYPWDVRATGQLGRILAHARALSAAARGLTLVYYRLIHLARRQEKAAADVTLEFDQWRARVARDVKDWDLNEFDALLADGALPTRANDVAFLRGFQEILKQTGTKRGISDVLSKFVRSREMARKRTKCRLCGLAAHRRYLRQWKRPDDSDEPYALMYRHNIGQRVLTEILEGLSGHVQA